jgi:ribosomal protein S18 acetylase RimI-like enzyme
MRHPTPEDIPAVIDLAKSIKLFDSDDEIDELIRKPLEEYMAARGTSSKSSSQWWVAAASEEDKSSSSIAGATFTAPQEGESGAFNMYFIGVRPEVQRTGLGAKIVATVEEWAKVEQGAERLLVETAAHMSAAQAFYKKMGFVERKRIPDLYGPGIDAVQFVKQL